MDVCLCHPGYVEAKKWPDRPSEESYQMCNIFNGIDISTLLTTYNASRPEPDESNPHPHTLN